MAEQDAAAEQAKTTDRPPAPAESEPAAGRVAPPKPDAEPAGNASTAAPVPDAVTPGIAETPASRPPDSEASSPPDASQDVTVVPGVPRYHDAACILIRFMGKDDLETMSMAAAKEAGCTPCRACLPEQTQASPR